MTTNNIRWLSNRNTCNMCEKDISAGNTPFFVDGKTNNKNQEWALMCPECFKIHGVGLGIGLGQKYNGNQNAELIEGYDELTTLPLIPLIPLIYEEIDTVIINHHHAIGVICSI
jgi:hypothetical protein